MNVGDKNLLIERQYKIAIEARNNLSDNFHKWMTYFYVANGAILVAITTLYNKSQADPGILILSLIGIFVCILWNLSCKGYYYWSKNWITIITRLEKMHINDDLNFAVYSIFSKEVANKEDSSWIPNKPANISTPKLTLLFSLFSVCSWAFFSGWKFFNQYTTYSEILRILIIIGSLIIISIIYIYILPKIARSRVDDINTLF